MAGSEAVLEVAFPKEIPAPESITGEFHADQQMYQRKRAS